MTIKDLRQKLMSDYGLFKYRLTNSGEIHVRGLMPNTNEIGWYLFGYVDDEQTERRIMELSKDLGR